MTSFPLLCWSPSSALCSVVGAESSSGGIMWTRGRGKKRLIRLQVYHYNVLLTGVITPVRKNLQGVSAVVG
jgi:hypothetical protein